jgi:hypothetical protein
LNEAFEWIQKRTAILPCSPNNPIANFTGWNAKAFYFHDNQQNILEFITHFDLQKNSELPFSPFLIDGICETGVVVNDVKKACENFNAYDIPYFIKGPHLDDFSVMGDSNGLFIISKAGRGWVPTQRASEPHWTKVCIENEGVEKEFVFE